jgi:hypothetical protein
MSRRDNWPQFTAEDQAFVERCVERVVAGLPPPLRKGVATARSTGSGGSFAYCVPPDMWDGQPDEQGLVRWKHLVVAPPSRSFPFDLYQGRTPPVLKAYLRTQRLPRVPLRAGDRTVMLPGTPTHQPLHDWRRVIERGVHLVVAAEYLPFAESDDGAWLYCFDRFGVAAEEDGPVVVFRAEDVFRVTPRLIGVQEQHDVVGRLVRPLFGSLREMLTTLCLGAPASWAGPEDCPFVRPALGVPAAYDWEPWLTPEPAPDREALPQNAAAVDLRAVTEHCARIGDKVRLLGRLDPARLLPGSEEHLHRLNPRLLAEERRAFESAEGCLLPEAYAQFLMQVGNGGAGPWKGLWRVERSGGWWAAVSPQVGGGDEDFEGRLRRPFPHRATWEAEHPDDEDEEAWGRYHAAELVDGTVYLGHLPVPEGGLVDWHLVVNGPEQGHVWADHRRRGEGIVPVLRRGPYSFLAWYEAGIDRSLSHIHKLYQETADEARQHGNG